MSNYNDQTNDELRAELEERGLKVSGTKDELVERLEADDAASGDAPEEPDEAAEEATDVPLTSASDSPGRAQVIKEDGWTVQQGNWRKGAGKTEED